jgi:hypothetical protein
MFRRITVTLAAAVLAAGTLAVPAAHASTSAIIQQPSCVSRVAKCL